MRALSRKYANRKSLLRNLATSLVLYERITTTTAKAKETKPIVERLINRSKTGDLAARRRLLAYFFDEKATKKVLEVLVPRYKDKKSGFVRIYKLGTRLGDGAEESILELDKAPIAPKEKTDDNVLEKTEVKDTKSNTKEKNGKNSSTTKKDK